MSVLNNLVLEKLDQLGVKPETPTKEKQKMLDEITPEVMSGLKNPYEICHHMAEVYGKTVDKYKKTLHNRDVIDEIVQFMDMLPEHSLVLDIGCGPGRDTFFMSVKDQSYRKNLMNRLRIRNGKTTLEKFPVPQRVFDVIGIDNAAEMIARAELASEKLKDNRLLLKDNMYPMFCYADMHGLVDEFLQGFGGIWSCTALFTHTPQALLEPAMRSVIEALNPKGVFFTSYTNGRGGKYDNLRVSDTGEIKYFSQPDPDDISTLAKKFGLTLTSESYNDFTDEKGNVSKENLFVSQFYRKN